MTILSIDVGIKNLALCLLSTQKEIILWDVLNIAKETAAEPSNTTKKEKCSLCKNNAKYRKNETFYCTRHAKETAYHLPCGDLLPSKIEKMKLSQLKELVDTYSIDTAPIENTKKLKENYIAVIKSTILEKVEDEENASSKGGNVSQISLVTISRIMTSKLDRLLEGQPPIETVIIENQISPIATRMTSIQGMLTQYFIMKNPNQQIHYISAKNKLKEFDVDKESYAERKKSSIEVCKTLLAEQPHRCSFLTGHKKKDDLADCYLQGIWYINSTSTNAKNK
jgi:hypothetical protein